MRHVFVFYCKDKIIVHKELDNDRFTPANSNLQYNDDYKQSRNFRDISQQPF